ncbi:carbonic anhydrase family protein [Mastigocoleus sp. MO_188.B34]|uniref:carbonic anhydrase family protein n=1 Tax=Mastigocoleus sp. MO_188.B34 TaxID=3036635 RepID=UPI00262F9D3D|nr:carbonic anhydrase family protein [Mastigocoleus sp. MO_188.B34]MDJ0695207.1 carbonic anhydrase family protein [Mastigocoleus sp. MO_188.B34]
MTSNSRQFLAQSFTQSPTNISKADTPTQSFSKVLKSYYQSSPIDIFNNGHNIDGEFETQQNYVIYQGERYNLKGFHFHTNSEHTFNGQNTAGEIHLVHESESGKKLVVGILLEEVSPDSQSIDPQLSSFLGKLDGSTLKNPNTIIDGGNFDPSKLISGDSQVYNYGGSLTTEPFTDATWVVAKDTLKVSVKELKNFSNLQSELYGFPNGLNNRNIQNELYLGKNGDDFLQGDRNGPNSFSNDLIYVRDGEDTVNGGQGNDKIFGEQGKDYLFGGQGNDILIGDGRLGDLSSQSSDEDYLIGGGGEDSFYISGDDFVVGGGPNRYSGNFIDFLGNESFGFDDGGNPQYNLFDGQQDTFIFINDGNSSTVTITGFEAGIDRIDLREYNLGSVDSYQSFQDIQKKDGGLWWEYKTSNVNGAEVVLRIDADPNTVNAALI